MAAIDTHRAIEKIIATGVSKETAEAIVDTVSSRNDDVATKSDISELKIEISWLKTISIANFGMILGAIVTLLIKQF